MEKVHYPHGWLTRTQYYVVVIAVRTSIYSGTEWKQHKLLLLMHFWAPFLQLYFTA